MAGRSESVGERTTKALIALALRYPETTTAGVCVNTAVRARNKNFVFIGLKDATYSVRLKLGASQGVVAGLAKTHPETYQGGSSGWAFAQFRNDEAPPAGLLEGWIDESFRLLAPKTLVKQLPDTGPPA